MGLLGVFVGLLMPLCTVWTVVLAVRNGPFRNRWWRGETIAGFTLAVAWICFLVGFVGPMIFAPSANQGPLLGILYTGPFGLVAGFVWSLLRAARRRSETA